ncbi:ABC transporter permease [Nocardiopsis ganjiahuensis]|uniref:ABC transporter permease n=1 Tax=Nocardiopsis ganjiahuensis TaxID=239984 RepID=UPI00034AD6DE|nr:ABC transporter permease [Nocardiopsis ganjiahuensis]
MITPVQAARTVRHAAVIARADLGVVYSWRTWLFGWLIRLLCQMVFYSLVGVLVGDPEYTVHIVLGAAVMTCVAETMLATASTCWDRHQGTMGLLTASPVEPGVFYFGRSLQWPASATATTSIALLAVPPFFGIAWEWHQVPVLVGIVVLTCLSTYCMTMLVASFALVLSEARNIISAISTTCVIAISGAMVPVEFWPVPVQWIAQALPVTHGLAAVRAVEAGAPASAVLASVGLMLLAAACWLSLALVSFRQVFARARTGNGALD